MYKDEILNNLAAQANVAQFVSYGPDRRQRFSRIASFAPNHIFPTVEDAISALMAHNVAASVNLRTFRPNSLQGNPFLYGLSDPREIMGELSNLLSKDYYVIINETIDVADGGVSGVIQRGCAEFAPGVIPRFVEGGNSTPIQTLPVALAMKMLNIAYEIAAGFHGFAMQNKRIEFSIHPEKQGYLQEHMILWEMQDDPNVANVSPSYIWPCAFSKFIGDKAYGLLLGHLLGAPVPFTSVYLRNKKIRPFSFGIRTGIAQEWTRTCPAESEPGRFTTIKGGHNPYELMEHDDPQGIFLASCIIQDGISAQYSGALITDNDGNPVIEGAAGYGDSFMLGEKKPDCLLPSNIKNDVMGMYENLTSTLGKVGFEWVHDGQKVWLLQLHKGASLSCGKIIFSGNPKDWIIFDTANGLDKLRALAVSISGKNMGVKLEGNPGLTSHIADVLRKMQIPSVIC